MQDNIKKFNDKNLKIVPIIVIGIILALFIYIPNVYADSPVDWYDVNGEDILYDGNALKYCTRQLKATSSITYRTIGFSMSVRIDGERYTAMLPLTSMEHIEDSEGAYCYDFYSVTIQKLVETFKKFNADSNVFDAMITRNEDTLVAIDSILTICYSGVPQGSVDADWNYYGKVYDSLSKIQNAAHWDSTTMYSSLPQEFDRRVTIPAKEKPAVEAEYYVQYMDITTGDYIALTCWGKVVTQAAAPTKVTVEALDLKNYEFVSTYYTYGGEEFNSKSSKVDISVFAEGRNKVIFFYKPKTTPPSEAVKGTITFSPNSTKWTNKGKIGEGKGKYPVTVMYNGDNPMIKIATWSGSHTYVVDGDKPYNMTYPCEGSIPVRYKLESIKVTGSDSGTVKGTKGTVYITKEGSNLDLSGESVWGDAEYTLPDCGCKPTIPAANTITGKSGTYMIDWTKPSIGVTEVTGKWINTPMPYKINIKASDNLSGFSEDSKVILTDSSYYQKTAEEIITSNKLSYNRAVMVTDGMFNIEVHANDVAGNENTQSFGKYLIDGTSPTVKFSVHSNGLTAEPFSEANGAIRKDSEKGNGQAYYGTIEAQDNLSGVSKIQCKWSYSKDKPVSGYEKIYESTYTLNDRHEEVISKDVEKPVGDNLYLHVEMWDVAGNYKYKNFGPFEDPILLKSLEITDIRDPRWKEVFWNDDEYQDYKGFKFNANELAIDSESHPTLKNALPKKGYAFYFNITSEYLYRENDRVEVKPTFYYLKGNKRIRVDCYFDNNNNPLTKIGGEYDDSAINLSTEKYGDVLIGSYSKLILTKGVRHSNGRDWSEWKDEIQYQDGKEQYWYGKYFIPSSTFCVKQGDEPRPENKLTGGNILVNFEITAFKNGIETFSYNQIYNYNSTQWPVEGGVKDNYNVGDVIIYNGKYGANSDSTTRIIH